MSSTYKTLQHLLDLWQGVGVHFHMCIQAAKVNTELQASILLPNQYYGIAPSTLTRLDGA